jgi:ElaB/YqjD/DUF883 family membrane-anchored ribosome-binding protein
MRDDFGNQRAQGAVAAPPVHVAENDAALDAGKVMAIAGGAAGALAGLWVLVSERQKEPEPATSLDQARAMLREAADRAKKEGAGAGSSLLSSVEHLASDASKQGKKRKKKAAKKSAKLGKRADQHRSDAIDSLVQTLKSTREDVVKHYGPELAGLIHQLREDAAGRLDEAKKRSGEYSSTARKDAEKARGEVSSLVDTLKSKAVDVEHQAEGLLTGVVAPKVTGLAHEAQSLLETGKGRSDELKKKAEKELLPEARKRAEELRTLAEKDLVPEAKKRADELKKKAEKDVLPEAKKRAEHLSHAVEDQMKTARKTIEESSSEAALKLHQATENVEHQAADAAEAVKRGGRETRSLLLWIALAGVLIFTVFLDEEQQKRLKEIAFEIFGEAKDMYADMKGQDSTFSM